MKKCLFALRDGRSQTRSRRPVLGGISCRRMKKPIRHGRRHSPERRLGQGSPRVAERLSFLWGAIRLKTRFQALRYPLPVEHANFSAEHRRVRTMTQAARLLNLEQLINSPRTRRKRKNRKGRIQPAVLCSFTASCGSNSGCTFVMLPHRL